MLQRLALYAFILGAFTSSLNAQVTGWGTVGVLDVRDYGCIADGTTDNTPCMNTVIDTACSTAYPRPPRIVMPFS